VASSHKPSILFAIYRFFHECIEFFYQFNALKKTFNTGH
jgi:hypothetical protein